THNGSSLVDSDGHRDEDAPRIVNGLDDIRVQPYEPMRDAVAPGVEADQIPKIVYAQDGGALGIWNHQRYVDFVYMLESLRGAIRNHDVVVSANGSLIETDDLSLVIYSAGLCGHSTRDGDLYIGQLCLRNRHYSEKQADDN